MNNEAERLHPRHRIWEMVALVLGIAAATGTIAGVLGKAFYVPRSEYTDKVISDTVSRTEITETLSRVNITLQRQENAFDKLSDKVEAFKTEVLRTERQRGR